MEEIIRKIKFKGKNYLLIGDKDGPIATKKQYETFSPSYAYLYTNGNIYRYGVAIGNIKDIEFGKEVQVEQKSLEGMFDKGRKRG